MTQRYSISRLHKLAERLKQKISELNQDAKSALAATSVRGTITSLHVNHELDSVKAGISALEEAEALARELAVLRSTIAAHNERLGVNEKLAKQDALNRQLTILKDIISGAALQRQLLSSLEVGASTGDYGHTYFRLTDEALTALKSDVSRIQREIFGLADAVAEANATLVEVTIPENVSALITG